MSATTTARTRILVAPDKFKGSLTAAQVAEALAAGLRRTDPDLEVRAMPVADGGDGSVAAALGAGFEALSVPITGPTGEGTTTTVAFDGTTAVVEVATTSGLQMLPPGRPAPLTSSSVGVGQAIRAVLTHRPARIVLALGGSATTDGGAGMLSALGAVFHDALGRPFVPTGGTLGEITDIDLTGLADFDGTELVAAGDVQNPLLGRDGAAAVYGPQKGATPADVEVLEAGLGCLIRRLWEVGRPAAEAGGVPGAGAAGGLGFAAVLLGARTVSGADFFLNRLGFDEEVTGCDLVVTGEGKLDTQTLSGKLPLVVDRLPEHGIERVHELSAMTDRDSSADPGLSVDLLHDVGRRIAGSLTPASPDSAGAALGTA